MMINFIKNNIWNILILFTDTPSSIKNDFIIDCDSLYNEHIIIDNEGVSLPHQKNNESDERKNNLGSYNSK
jgi:hypothetical protein